MKLRDDHPRIIEMVIAIADAVHHAHQRGILHRDLKPGNILIDHKGQPWVTDFGLARNLQSDSQITHTGAVVGTPGFMSPEQASGSGVTTATDIYSLGAILYQLICGRPPHQSETVLQTLRAVTDDEPDPPRKWAPQLDADLELICLKCLEKQPFNRYTSAGELADELRAFRAGDPLHVRPPTARELTRKWLSKRVGNAAWIPVIAIFVGLLSGFAIWVGTVGEDLANYLPTYQAYASEPMPALAIDWPDWFAKLLILGFLFTSSTIGWWTAKLVQTKNRFADLGAGASVGLLSGLIATIAGVGTPFIYLATTSLVSDLDLLHTLIAGGQINQGLPPIDQRYPDLEEFSSLQKASLLVNKIKGDRIIATLVGPMLGTMFCLLTFGIAGTFQTYVAGPLLRERSRWSAMINYSAFAMALVAILFVFGSELTMYVILGSGSWFDPTGPLLMGSLAMLTIVSIIRRWVWPVSAGLSLLWLINFATVIFNPHIQGPVPQTPMKRNAIADARRLMAIDPARRDYQVALARAEFDYGELLRNHGMPKHSLEHYRTSLELLATDQANVSLDPNISGLHSAALFWGSLAAMQGGDAATAAQWSTQHLSRYESSNQAAELYVRSVVASGQPVEKFIAQGDALSPDVWWRIAQQLRSLAMHHFEKPGAGKQDWLNGQVEQVLTATTNQQVSEAWADRRLELKSWLLSQQSWELYGPFKTAGTKTDAFQSIHGPEVELIAGEPVNTPKRTIVAYPGAPVWLQQHLTASDQVVAFASSRVKLDQAGPLFFRLGSDDAIKIWIDDQLVFARNLDRGLYPVSDVVELPRLDAGVHRVLVKVYNWNGDWGFAIDGGTLERWPSALWSSAQ